MNEPIDPRKLELINEYRALHDMMSEAGITYDTGISDPFLASPEDLITKIRFMKFMLRTPRG